jgi:hypothetical protein
VGARDLLKRTLAEHPEIAYVEDGNRLEVPAADETGFDVVLEEDGGRTEVYFDGWHEGFDDPAEAVACFVFGLSEEGRLRVTQRGSFASSWALESMQDGQWIEDGFTRLLIAPIWRRKNVVYKQNHWLSTP